MNPIIKKLIEANIEHIENNEFGLVYERALAVNMKIDIGELTDIFYDSGIDPLAHLEYVPPLFFDESSITAVSIPENIKVIYKSGCAFSKLEHVELHNNCELSPNAFMNSNIKKIIIPYIMNEVPEECFYGCRELSEVDLNAVDQIGPEAFYGCSNLTQMFIPDDINYIADSAFEGCPVTLLFHSDNEYAIDYCQKTHTRYKFV